MSIEGKNTVNWWRASKETIGATLVTVLFLQIAMVVQNPDIQKALAGITILSSGISGAMLIVDSTLKNKK